MQLGRGSGTWPVASKADRQSLGRLVMVVLQPVLVPDDLAIELVHHLVDGGIEAFVRLLDEDVATLREERHFDLLPAFLLLQILDREEHVHDDHLVEVPRHAIELRLHVLTQRRRDLQVMAPDRQIHLLSLVTSSWTNSTTLVAAIIPQFLEKTRVLCFISHGRTDSKPSLRLSAGDSLETVQAGESNTEFI